MQTQVNRTHSEMGPVRQNQVQSDVVTSDLKLQVCNREFQSVIWFTPRLVISHWRHSVLELSVRPCVISY